MSNVSNILIEAVADLVRAFTYETHEYLKKQPGEDSASFEARKNKLHQAANWKTIFDNVAQRYVKDLYDRGLRANQRVNIDMKALLRSTKADDKYLTLLKTRTEVQDYLKKQILLYGDKEAVRVLKYREPREFAEKEKSLSTTIPTPKVSKHEQNIKDQEVGFKTKVGKVGSGRHVGGSEFERRVAKALAGDNPVNWTNTKVKIDTPTQSTIAQMIYDTLQKTPELVASGFARQAQLTEVAENIKFNTEALAKHDFEYKGINYEAKKANIYSPSLFAEVWKIASESSLKSLIDLMGSKERAQIFYNNFVERLSKEHMFKSRILGAVRKKMIDLGVHIVGLNGPVSSTSEVVIFNPGQVEYSLVIPEGKFHGTKRMSIYFNVKKGAVPERSLGAYGNLHEDYITNFLIKDLLREHVSI